MGVHVIVVDVSQCHALAVEVNYLYSPVCL
jgi:hypothetical protein